MALWLKPAQSRVSTTSSCVRCGRTYIVNLQAMRTLDDCQDDCQDPSTLVTQVRATMRAPVAAGSEQTPFLMCSLVRCNIATKVRAECLSERCHQARLVVSRSSQRLPRAR